MCQPEHTRLASSHPKLRGNTVYALASRYLQKHSSLQPPAVPTRACICAGLPISGQGSLRDRYPFARCSSLQLGNCTPLLCSKKALCSSVLSQVIFLLRKQTVTISSGQWFVGCRSAAGTSDPDAAIGRQAFPWDKAGWCRKKKWRGGFTAYWRH